MKNKGLQHASVMRNSPVSKQICLSFSSWQGNFVRVIAPPSSPKLLLIPEFQFPPLCWRWVLTYFSLLSDKRERSGREQRRRTAQLSPTSFRFKNTNAVKEMLLRSLPRDIHLLTLPKTAQWEMIARRKTKKRTITSAEDVRLKHTLHEGISPKWWMRSINIRMVSVV